MTSAAALWPLAAGDPFRHHQPHVGTDLDAYPGDLGDPVCRAPAPGGLGAAMAHKTGPTAAQVGPTRQCLMAAPGPPMAGPRTDHTSFDLLSASRAWAAASRAPGTRKGELET